MSSAGGTSDNVAERTVLLFRHSAIILSIGAIIFAIVGRPLIQILYGRAFLPSYVPFVLLLPSIMLQGLSQVLSSFLAFEARFGLASIGAGLMVIVNAVGSFLLIPHFGMAGAAIGTAAGQLVLTVFMLMSVSILSKTSLGEFLPKVSDLQVYHRMIAARFSTRSLKQ
jgi:O-antigen/teichoic acid export membrane protein